MKLFLTNALIKFYTFWNSLSEGQRAVYEFILDVGSAGVMVWLLYYLNSPWWGYVVALICCTIQKAVTDK